MKQSRNVYRCLAMITQFGINMLVPIFLCSFAGMAIDKYLGTSIFMILLFFVGAMAGFRNIYIFSVKLMNHSDEKERRDARKNKEQSSKQSNPPRNVD